MSRSSDRSNGDDRTHAAVSATTRRDGHLDAAHALNARDDLRRRPRGHGHRRDQHSRRHERVWSAHWHRWSFQLLRDFFGSGSMYCPSTMRPLSSFAALLGRVLRCGPGLLTGLRRAFCGPTTCS